MSNNHAGAFSIGLVQAGAISAGAYTAGVIDFLIEALDQWELHRGEPGVPRHEVCLKVISGASAGAMTAAIAAVALHSDTRPVRYGRVEPAPELNRLYDAWVRRIGIKDLLSTSDMKDCHPAVRSLFNSDVLQSIAEEALRTKPRQRPRSYVSTPLPVVFALSNLRGVPYGFKMYMNGKYIMMNHMDNMHFYVGPRQGRNLDERHLDPSDLHAASSAGLPAGWSAYIQAALASGAFPIGLAARHLRRPATDYGDCCDTGICKSAEPVPDPFNFVAVDGGLMDNEPLQLARSVMSGGVPEAGRARNQYGLFTKRALVLIDPFPNTAAPGGDYAEDDAAVRIAIAMFSALKDQARFHPDELEAAENEDVFSRYAISPSRDDEHVDTGMQPPLCSACLGGFGGFLKKKFRAYDFHLGRRNCQRFLQRHFRLPEDNPLFDCDTGRNARDPLYVRDDNGEILERPIGIPDAAALHMDVGADDAAPRRFLPIIPLVGEAKVPSELPPLQDWLTEAEWSAIDGMIRERVRAIGDVAIDSELPRVLGHGFGARTERWILRNLLWPKLISGQVAERVARAAREQVVIRH